MSSWAPMSPNDGTGALNHAGSRARASLRKVASRGQSGQSRSGSPQAEAAPGGAASFLLFEIVVIDPRRPGGGARRELRRVMTRLARGWTFRRIATELGLQLHQIGEDVGL